MVKFKVYKTRPKGWEATDPVRDRKQGMSFLRGGYGKDTKVRLVQTGKRGDIFPYTIYTKYRKR